MLFLNNIITTQLQERPAALQKESHGSLGKKYFLRDLGTPASEFRITSALVSIGAACLHFHD
jgi:hypothetical protein